MKTTDLKQSEFTRVELEYFKRETGKFYSSAHYYTWHTALFEIFREVKEMQVMKMLPGLRHGADFFVHVDVPDHPDRHPALII